MKVFIISIFALLISISAFAQDPEKEATVDQGWKKSGKFTILFNQSAFSNWTAGGENNISGTLGLNYDINYFSENITWDTKFIVAYGMSKNEDEDQKKTDDRLEINSVLGKKASENWYYSWFINGKTQMDVGYDSDTGSEISHGYSPLYLQTGPGMLWKKSDDLKVNFAPLTAKMVLVHGHFTEFGESFGVEQGETTRFEFGAAIGAYYKLTLMENVTMENILNLYSNYLEDPQNVDIDYTMNLVMTINKYLSANLSFQTIYDDNAYKGFQIREVFGLGVNFGF
jgi:hypothetical protein